MRQKLLGRSLGSRFGRGFGRRFSSSFGRRFSSGFGRRFNRFSRRFNSFGRRFNSGFDRRFNSGRFGSFLTTSRQSQSEQSGDEEGLFHFCSFKLMA